MKLSIKRDSNLLLNPFSPIFNLLLYFLTFISILYSKSQSSYFSCQAQSSSLNLGPCSSGEFLMRMGKKLLAFDILIIGPIQPRRDSLCWLDWRSSQLLEVSGVITLQWQFQPIRRIFGRVHASVFCAFCHDSSSQLLEFSGVFTRQWQFQPIKRSFGRVHASVFRACCNDSSSQLLEEVSGVFTLQWQFQPIKSFGRVHASVFRACCKRFCACSHCNDYSSK